MDLDMTNRDQGNAFLAIATYARAAGAGHSQAIEIAKEVGPAFFGRMPTPEVMVVLMETIEDRVRALPAIPG